MTVTHLTQERIDAAPQEDVAMMLATEQHPAHRPDLPTGNCSCPDCLTEQVRHHAPHLLHLPGGQA